MSTVEEVLSGAAQWCMLHGDGDEIALSLADASVDHAILDPEYDQKTHAGARSLRGCRSDAVPHAGVDLGIDFAPLGDMSFVRDLVRVSKRWVIAFCVMRQFAAYEEAAGNAWVRDGIWHRTNSAPQFTGDRPAQGCEGLAIMHRPGKKRWNRGGHQAFWDGPIEHTERVHPTQKPLWLLLEIIEAFTDPGDVVLDTRAGSGTTGIACLRLGRRFIGVEKQGHHHAAAVERLTAAQRGTTVAAMRSGQCDLFGLFAEKGAA